MHLKILGRKVKVKIIPQEKIAALSDDKHTIGLFDPNCMTIFIAENLSEPDKLYILTHEAVHCSHYLTGLDQSIPEPLIEVICQTTATLFMDLIKR